MKTGEEKNEEMMKRVEANEPIAINYWVNIITMEV